LVSEAPQEKGDHILTRSVEVQVMGTMRLGVLTTGILLGTFLGALPVPTPRAWSAQQAKQGVAEPVPPAARAFHQRPDNSQKDIRFSTPVEAVAPRERLKAIKVVQIKGQHQMFDGTRAVRDFVMTWEGVDRTKVEQSSKGVGRLKLNQRDSLTVLLIRNQGWVALGNNQRKLEGDGLGFYQNFHYGTLLSNLIALTDEGFQVVPAGDVPVRGTNCFVVLVKRAGKPDLKMFFARDTKLLFKTEFTGRFLDQSLRYQRSETFVEFFFSNYKVVDGVNHWHVREQWRNGKKASVLSLSEVRFLPKSDDSLFYFPAFDREVKKALADRE
jgi:hypothetical protein